MKEILDHLERGPRTADELSKLVSVSRKTLYKRLKKLVESGELIMLPMLVKNHWTSLYALPKHRDLAVEICGYAPVSVPSGVEPKIVKAIDELRFKLCRNPDVAEIAIEIGESPEDRTVRDAIYRIGSKVGWRPPTDEERSEGEKRRKLIVELAAWCKKGYLEALKGRPAELVSRAREYLRRYPELVPDI